MSLCPGDLSFQLPTKVCFSQSGGREAFEPRGLRLVGQKVVAKLLPQRHRSAASQLPAWWVAFFHCSVLFQNCTSLLTEGANLKELGKIVEQS